MQLQKIIIVQATSWFFCRGESAIIAAGKIREEFLYKEQEYSRIYRAGDKLLKVCCVQSWPKDVIRKYFAKSQADRERKSAEMLAGLGLNTPQSYFCAFSLSPSNRFESMHEMSFLDHHEHLNKHLSQRQDSEEIVRLIAADLAIMTNNMLCLKDFGLGNIMYDPNGKIFWIDNDIKEFSDRRLLAAFMMRHLKLRLLNHINAVDANAFWEVFKERALVCEQLLQEFKSVNES